MSTLFTRALSAIGALLFVGLLYYFLKLDGLRVLCLLAVVLGTRELIQILFKPDDSLTIKTLFYVFMILIFIMTVRFVEYSSVFFAGVATIFFSLSLVFLKRFEDLQSLSLFQAKSILGFLYLGLLPAFACKLLDLNNGIVWFLTLTGIVFAGDTIAYLTGMAWGKKKIMPQVSPKKTIVGAIGGLFGSVIAAGIAGLFLPHIPIYAMLPLGLLAGAIGQFGDLFESMLKRVADVKDSGSIMPGHGGVLDRIDGVLFAAPLVLLFASVLEKIF